MGEEVIVADPYLRSDFRQESAKAETECYLFELDTVKWEIIKKKLKSEGCDMDFFTLSNFFKN